MNQKEQNGKRSLVERILEYMKDPLSEEFAEEDEGNLEESFDGELQEEEMNPQGYSMDCLDEDVYAADMEGMDEAMEENDIDRKTSQKPVTGEDLEAYFSGLALNRTEAREKLNAFLKPFGLDLQEVIQGGNCAPGCMIVNAAVDFYEASNHSTVSIGEIQVVRGRNTFWLSLEQGDGFLYFFRTDKSARRILAARYDEDAFQQYGGQYEYLERENLLPFTCRDVLLDQADMYTALLRYLMYLVHCDKEQAQAWIRATAGRFVGSLVIPCSWFNFHFPA